MIETNDRNKTKPFMKSTLNKEKSIMKMRGGNLSQTEGRVLLYFELKAAEFML